jgi:hypothetical protein
MDDNPYSIDRGADGDRIVVMCKGAEFATAATVEEAAIRCAEDAIAGYPEVTSDIMYDVVAECGQMLGNVVHMTWFKQALAEAIMGDWPELPPVPGRVG